jgi:fructose/tagatose bisphosphate aldolase
MALTHPSRLFGLARSRGFAVGYFESWDLSSLQGVIDAAELAAAPVVIGFNGDFLSGEGRLAAERIGWYAGLGRAAAESARVPCAFIFNECPRDEWVLAAVDSGFNLVMPADPHAPPAEYRQRVQRVVEYAHARNVAVEAELDELPCGASGMRKGAARVTDAEAAADFVAETGVDLFAVSVGNVHISVRGQYSLDCGAIEKLAARVGAGLVLHGGTGIPEADLRRAAAAGVVKVNFGTYMKQAWLKAMRSALRVDEINPHELLGMGGEHDILVKGRLAVRDAVLARIDSLGCGGMAPAYASTPGTQAPL